MGPYSNPNMQQPLPGQDASQQTPGTPAPPTSALSKDQVGYRPATSKAQSCGVCAHYLQATEQALGNGLCDIVAGEISPNATCDMFTPAGGLQSLAAQQAPPPGQGQAPPPGR